MSPLLTVVGISLLIVLHELGHYGIARACGMRVLRFSLGFGPVLWKRSFGETIWQVAAIPLGGFVHIDGMSSEEQNTDDARSYRNRPRWQRALVLFAGPGANWLTAAVFMVLLATTVGFRHYDESVARLGDVVPEGPAAVAGLQSGDQILRIANVETHDWQSLVAAVRAHPEQAIEVEALREGTKLKLQLTPRRAPGADYGMIEVGPYSEIKRYGPLTGISAGIQATWELSIRQISLISGLFSGKQKGQFLGLPGIIKTVSQQAQNGMGRLLEALAWLSIGLCILNLLPVPALDGSRLLFLAIEGIRGRPVSEKVEGYLHTVGFFALLLLMVAMSLRDIVGFVKH